MRRFFSSRPFLFLLALAVAAAVTVVPTSFRSAGPGQDAQQGQQQQGQSDQSQGQSDSQSQGKQKKKGGFLSGVKSMKESSKEQKSATASAGTMGVGEGAQIGDVTPTPADRQAVTQMENYSVAQGDLNQFIQGGHLKPKQ